MRTKKVSLRLASVAGILLLAYLLVAFARPGPSDGRLFPLEHGSYKMITIAHPGDGDYLIFESTGSDWALTLPYGYDYDQARANGLALAIASL